jgi:serine/threonine-protein kinase HipA
MSAATLLQVRRDDEHAYTELLDAMRTHCQHYAQDARQLWRRLVFNHLITNVDDHLQNTGFLYVGQQQWQLAPAFDLNPFPDKTHESKTWLSEDTGPITSVHQLLQQAPRFELDAAQAKTILAQVVTALVQWRAVAQTPEVGMTAADVTPFIPAFEHIALQEAQAAL